MAGLAGHVCFGLAAVTTVLLLGVSLLCPALAEPEPEPEASPDADAFHNGGHRYTGYGGGYSGSYGPSRFSGKKSPEPEPFHHHLRHLKGYGGYGSSYSGGNRVYYKRSADADPFHHHGHHPRKGYGINHGSSYYSYGYGKRSAAPDADPEGFHHHGHYKGYGGGGYGLTYRRNYGYGKRSAEPDSEPEAFHHYGHRHGHHSKGYGVGYELPYRSNYGYGKRSAEPEADANPEAFHRHYGHHRYHAPSYRSGSSYGYGKRSADAGFFGDVAGFVGDVGSSFAKTVTDHYSHHQHHKRSAEPEAFHHHHGYHTKKGFGVQKGYGSPYGGYYKRSAEAESFHHHGHGNHQSRGYGYERKGFLPRKHLGKKHHHKRGAEDSSSGALECIEVTEEVCEGVCMERKCETTMVNSCKTVTKTGECEVRWEEECTNLPHEVQTGVTNKEVTRTVCKPGLQLPACPPPSLTSCTKESSVSQCWSADTYDSDCEGTLCCFNGCADVCLPPTERSCHEVKETVEEPKTEIVMKPVCATVPIEDCNKQVEECESIPIEKCTEVAVPNRDQVPQQRPTECPPPSMESCDPATSIANCWSPGFEDVDCLNHGLCCYNGCANVCLDNPATCAIGEDKMVCELVTRLVCDEGEEQEGGED